jgi:hypothetical protein
MIEGVRPPRAPPFVGGMVRTRTVCPSQAHHAPSMMGGGAAERQSTRRQLRRNRGSGTTPPKCPKRSA